MKKKILILGIIGLILVGSLVYAGVDNVKSVSIKTDTKTIFNDINKDTLMRGDIICKERTCSQKMWKGNYNLGEVTVNKWLCKKLSTITDEFNITNEICTDEVLIKKDKIIEELTKQQEKKLEEIAKVIKKRKEKVTDTVIYDSGTFVLK